MKQSALYLTNKNQINAETWIIVPAKPLSQAKSRLTNILTPQSRQNLAFHLLEHTLQILAQLQKVLEQVKILVISSDPILLRVSQNFTRYVLFDEDYADESDNNARLNKALEFAARFCAAQPNAQNILVLPADLPLLSLEDLVFVFEKAATIIDTKKFVISPDHEHVGTNALFLQPPALLDFIFQFGPASLKAHLALAESVGVTSPILLNRPGLLRDLDTASDFYSLSPELQQRLTANSL